jgi:hypothetical protein
LTRTNAPPAGKHEESQNAPPLKIQKQSITPFHHCSENPVQVHEGLSRWTVMDVTLRGDDNFGDVHAQRQYLARRQSALPTIVTLL